MTWISNNQDEVGDPPRLMLVLLVYKYLSADATSSQIYLTENRNGSNSTLTGKPCSIFSNICIITVDTIYMVLVIGQCRACDVGSNFLDVSLARLDPCPVKAPNGIPHRA